MRHLTSFLTSSQPIQELLVYTVLDSMINFTSNDSSFHLGSQIGKVLQFERSSVTNKTHFTKYGIQTLSFDSEDFLVNSVTSSLLANSTFICLGLSLTSQFKSLKISNDIKYPLAEQKSSNCHDKFSQAEIYCHFLEGHAISNFQIAKICQIILPQQTWLQLDPGLPIVQT